MKNVWRSQADTIDFQDKDILNILYENNLVRDFLSSDHSIGISATKGMGKTFLIKTKRFQMQSEENSGILFLPKDRLVDVSAPVYLTSGQMTLLSNYENWVDLWISLVGIYLLSLPELSNLIDEYDKKFLPNYVWDLINTREFSGIFEVLSIVLLEDNKALLMEVIKSSSYLFNKINKIQRAICLFVDKLEEPFNRHIYKIYSSSKSSQGPINQSIWAYSQVAFAEMTYRLSARNHVKIFYTIRQEALIGIEQISRESSKIKDNLCQLSYTSHELFEMYKKYISNETNENLCNYKERDTNPHIAFLDIETMPHRSGINESLWDYIYRHTLKRPRDVMEICNDLCRHIVNDVGLCSKTDGTKERAIRKWVNENSTVFCRTYLYDIEPFMSSNENTFFVEELLDLCKHLNTNVFTKEALEQACQKGNIDCLSDCVACDKTHYFSALQNIGLLGVIYKSNGEPNTYRCVIKNIGESVYESKKQTLVSGVLYYVHPGLSNIIKQETDRHMLTFTPSKLLIPNDSGVVDNDIVKKIYHFAISQWGNQFDKNIFLTSTQRGGMSTFREEVKSFLEERGYNVFAFETPEFPIDIDRKENELGQTHDHCINTLLSRCRHVIYLFDGDFGGKYSGSDFQNYINEEKTFDIQPSISFMEYYIASLYNKNVRVYVDEKVDIARGEYLENNKPKDYKSKHVTKPKYVFEQLGYFNDLGNGTWYDKYQSLKHLKDFLGKHFPDCSSN